jgi:chromate transporter
MILIHLTLTFGLLSLLAVGGGTAVLPEMQSILLYEFGLTHDRFVHIYSLGQLAPGPNMLMVLVIGLQVAGMLGAAVVFLSFFIPSSVLCLLVGRPWINMGESPWRRAIQNALEPISIGLMVSGVYAVGKAAAVTPPYLWPCAHRLCYLSTNQSKPGARYCGDRNTVCGSGITLIPSLLLQSGYEDCASSICMRGA